MKKISLLALIILCFSMITFGQDDEIIIGIYNNSPLLFEDDDGNAAGLMIDWINDFTAREKIDITYRFGSLKENFIWLEAGEIDWMPGIAYSSERDEKYFFNHEVLFINWGQIYSSPSNQIASMEDLIDRRIGVQKSDIHYIGTYGILNTMNQFSFSAEYIEYDSKEEIFRALSNEEIDAGVVNRIFGMLNENDFNVNKTPIQLNPVRMHLISLDETHKMVFDKFDQYLIDLKEDPESIYHTGIEKWFGNEIIKRIPEWLKNAMIALAIIVGLLLITVFYARYQVRIKTKEVKSLNDGLEKKVEERTALIEKQQEELVEASKMAALGQLVAGVAHEINTPIGVGITVSSHLGESTKKVKKKLDENQLKKSVFENYMKDICEGVDLLMVNLQKAGELIENFKQIAVDSHDIAIESVQLKPYTEMIFKSLKMQFKKKVINFDVSCPDDLSLSTYPGAYSQVFTNLIMNSFIHGFELVESGHIKIKFEETSEGIRCLYSDDGCGISQENISKIFDPFFTTKRGSGGSGLGLHIVYNVVSNRLGGKIKYKDDKQSGTTFEILLSNLGGCDDK